MANLTWAIEKKCRVLPASRWIATWKPRGSPSCSRSSFRLRRVPARLPPRLTGAGQLDAFAAGAQGRLVLADPLEIQLERAGMKRFYPAPAARPRIRDAEIF
jgi:hypothetical protein